MSRISVFLVVIALFFGGMIGYTVAAMSFYRAAQEPGPALSPPSPTAPSTVVAQRSDAAPFSVVIHENTGKAVLPVDSVCEPVLDSIGRAADRTLAKFNDANSPLIGLSRINEASRFFEDSLREYLDQDPLLTCAIPQTADGKSQRSGYPDLQITHLPTGRVFYLDPKLYEATSRESSLRTFYYTPRSGTSKILKPAHHLLIGFSHDGNDGHWKFDSWSLIDLSQTELTLKSEYNASNRDLYQTESEIRRSKTSS